MKGLKSSKYLRHERLKGLKSITGGNEQDDGDRQGLEVLLKFDVLVGRQDDVEGLSGTAEEFAVVEAGPLHFGDGSCVVPSEQ